MGRNILSKFMSHYRDGSTDSSAIIHQQMSERRRLPRLEMNEAQVLCLASDIRQQILAEFLANGPMSVAKVARLIPIPVKSAYYPVRRLLQDGLLMEVGVQGSGRQAEVIYDAVAEKIRFPEKIESAGMRKGVARMVASSLRRMDRLYSKAAERLAEQPDLWSLMFVLSRSVSLTPDEASELRARMNALHDFVRERHNPEKPIRMCLLSVMSPDTGGNG